MKVSLKQALAYTPWLLPAYVWRFSMGPVPTTVLEVGLVALFAWFTWERGWKGWRDGWQSLGAWQKPLLAWIVVTLLAVIVAPNHVAALGLWRAYVLEPALWFVMAFAFISSSSFRAKSDGAEESLRRVSGSKGSLHSSPSLLGRDDEGGGESDDFLAALRRQLFFVVWALALVAAFQFVTGWFIPSPWNVGILEGRRATSLFPFPNALALFVAPIGALAIARFLEKRTWMDGVTIIASVLAVALAKSEGAGAAMTAVAVIAGLASPKFRKWTALAMGIGCVALLTIAPLRTNVVQEVTFKGWSGKVRLVIWQETATMLKDHAFFGAGFGAYPTVIKPYHKATYLEIFQFPHNGLLNVWSETGVLGLLAVLWIAATWIRTGRTPRMVALAPLMAIAVHGLVDVPYFKNDLAVLFWMLVALSVFARQAELPMQDMVARQR